jgi:hypothetical protein
VAIPRPTRHTREGGFGQENSRIACCNEFGPRLASTRRQAADPPSNSSVQPKPDSSSTLLTLSHGRGDSACHGWSVWNANRDAGVRYRHAASLFQSRVLPFLHMSNAVALALNARRRGSKASWRLESLERVIEITAVDVDGFIVAVGIVIAAVGDVKVDCVLVDLGQLIEHAEAGLPQIDKAPDSCKHLFKDFACQCYREEVGRYGRGSISGFVDWEPQVQQHASRGS